MKKLLSILLALSLVACMFAGCSGEKPAESAGTTATQAAGTPAAETTEAPSASAEPIVIGLLDAFSGDRAMNGEYTREGAEMFLEDINAAGGVLGRPVTIIYEDDQGAEASATNAYQKLVSENEVCATVLNKYSSVVLAMEPFVADEQIPAICSGSSVKLEASTNEWLLSTRRSDTGSGVSIALHCKSIGATKVAILHSPDALGTGITPVIEKTLADNGVEVVSVQQFTADEKNFAPYMAKIKDSGCDMLVAIAQTNEAALIMKAVKDAGLGVPCIGNSAFAQSSTLSNAPTEASNGWYSVTAFSYKATAPKTAEWVKRYNDKYGRNPDMTSATTYDALSMICKAIELAGTDDPAAINEQLHKLDGFEGIASDYSYQGTPMLASSEYIIQIENGEAIVIDRISTK